ncbi:MAG: hypothetical protein V1850_00465 [Candidatus Bathyarchaeota archaeon]
MRDKSLGSLIFALGLIGAIVYVYWLFAPVTDTSNLLFYAPIGSGIRWAIVFPIVVAVLAILLIAMWIGYTMAVTPSPTLIEDAETKTKEQKKEG